MSIPFFFFWNGLRVLILIILSLLQYGKTPFKGHDRKATFKNILDIPVVFPDVPAVSSNCKNLIRKLLHKTEKKRLGSLNGATDIKRDPFFSGVNWACRIFLSFFLPPISFPLP